MGGNATKHLGSTRLSKADFDEIVSVLQPYNGVFFRICEGAADKESHGDLDILCMFPPSDILQLIHDAFKGRIEILGGVSNGNCKSYSIRFGNKPPFQVDLISIDGRAHSLYAKAEMFVWHSLFLMSDFGALVGNILRPFNICYTHEGLYYEVEHRGQTDRILLTDNVQALISFLDLQEHIPNSLQVVSAEHLYKIVARVPFIHGNYFGTRILNHKERHREKKRPIFAGFQEWYEQAAPYFKKAPFNPADMPGILKSRFGVDVLAHEAEIKKQIDERIEAREFISANLKDIADSEKAAAFKYVKKMFGTADLIAMSRGEKPSCFTDRPEFVTVGNDYESMSFFK